ncbi:FAD-binding oxidoreductase [Phormidium sp. CLA17]|uniref:NAD(P)/FAD-dependent oxidoreductase n=1 Tax=Leptolyngbya sp. Cla-17 TaxID=2803751 RepID=UPI0014908CA7|nr:FAD-dependent oxidoreductase [Leptolyngbya sp. Cla-17]MBM0741206.1 FAD-binding oxidoreductase [Leptolyngbya sp. Cla-17]
MKVVIIGCGIVGAAIAYELSQIPLLEIRVFDRQAPAQASTGAALGVLMAAISQKPKGSNFQRRLLGVETYDQWIPQLEAMTNRKIPYNRQGILRLCFAGEDLERWRSLAEIRRSQGLQLEICDRAYLAANYPHLNLEQVMSAVYSPGDRQVNPTDLTLALVAAAEQNRVTFHFNTLVEFESPVIPANSEKLSRLHTATDSIDLDWLIVAAGLGSAGLTASLQQPVDIRPVLGQALQVALEHPLGLPDRQPVITGNDLNLVPLGNGEYWIGATVEFGGVETQHFTVQPNADRLEAMMNQAIALVPALKNAQIIQQWSGLRPRPEGRSAPIVELLTGYSNVILASGHYRNGVLLAPATAKQVREIIQHDLHPQERQPGQT